MARQGAGGLGSPPPPGLLLGWPQQDLDGLLAWMAYLDLHEDLGMRVVVDMLLAWGC